MVFVGLVDFLVGSIILGILVATMDDGTTGKQVLTVAVLLLILGSIIWTAVTYARWATTNVVITSDRLIFRQGVLGKSGIEIPLERVNNVNFSQSVFERLIGAGDLLIESGGEDGQQRFTDIRHPEQVQKLIHEQMEGNEQRKFGGMRTASPAMIDPIAQLERLEALRDRGTITQEEFELQKRRILE
ncbi:MAG: PH domain-containing protein [Ilumatobacteraceae bacterium]